MQFIFETLIPALESTQASAFYALLVLLLLSSASLFLHNQAQPGKLDRRLSLGLGVLMGLRVIQLPVLVSAWLGAPAAQHAIAPLERSILLISFVTLAWFWARPNGESPSRQALFGIELLGALALAGYLLIAWQGMALGSPFNYTTLDYVWNSASLAVLVLGGAQILTSGQPILRSGLLQLGALFFGHLLHFFLPVPIVNMPLAVQAANLLSLPFLFAMPLRLPAIRRRPERQMEPIPPLPSEEPIPNIPAFFDFEQAEEISGGIGNAPKNEAGLHPAEELARQVAEQLHANLCLLTTVNEAQMQLELQYGYNQLRAAPVEMARIPLREVPRLTSAIKRGRALRLVAEQRLTELAVLSQALRLSFPGHLLAAPFSLPQDLRRWAVLLINVDRAWQLEDEVELEKVAVELGAKLAQALGISEQITETIEPIEEEFSQERLELEKLEAENERYRQDVERLLKHIDELKTGQKAGTGMAAAQSSELVAQLQQENSKLKSALASLEKSAGGVASPASLEIKQAKEELRLALEEVASLHARLEAAQQAMMEAGAQKPGGKIEAKQVELIASIAEELRQPLSSVLGYTDLLLGESVGILGALQRKFLERVRNSTERMNKLIDDLIRIAELDRAGYAVARKPVDLNGVIDDAISQLRAQFQEKRITLRVDLPRLLPQLNTDRDALQQILYHLLQNADAATPAEGAITLRAVNQEQPGLGEFVLIQVSDTGGGIPEEDLPRVFSRVYRATNPIIEGVGDTGVGLSIAETLTNALGGRIWVESEAGLGATFSVLLPLQQTQPLGGNV